MRASVFGGLGVLAVVLAGCAQPSQPPAETAATPPPPPAPPYEIHTLRDLINVCRTAPADPYYASAEGLCWGYVAGVLDFYQVDTATGHRVRRVCLPTTAPTRGEAVAGLQTWADANQQFLDELAPYGLMRFYVAQYPCPHPSRGRPPAPPRQ